MKAVQVKLVLLGEFFLFSHRVDEPLLCSSRLDQSLFLLDQSFSPIRPLLFTRRLLLSDPRILLMRSFSLLMPTHSATTLATHCFVIPHIDVPPPFAFFTSRRGGKLARHLDLASCSVAMIVFSGEAAVGKSSLVLRFVQNDFNENTSPTIGAAFLTQSTYDQIQSTCDGQWPCRGQGEQESVLTPHRMQA